MTILILNAVLAIAVVGMIVRLLSWAIVSSRADLLPQTTDHRFRAPLPHNPRPHAPHPHWPSANRQPVRESREPVTG